MDERTTKYVSDIREYMSQVGHASNAELLTYLRRRYADISATTVHRITTRLVARGKLAKAPSCKDNSARFDVTTLPHDHFLCSNCDMLRDAQLIDAIKPLVEQSIGDGCRISGNLVIMGLCKNCSKENL